MDYKNLGRSGLQVSVVGLGCNNFGMRCDYDQSEKVVHAAIDAGITLFDTADVYGGQGKSEEFLGRILKGKRDSVLVATKWGMKMGEGPHKSGGSRKYIMAAVEDSLRRLQTDYIDLYQLHRPDPQTPMEETLRALDDLISSGKVRYIGHSNFAGWQAAEAHFVAQKGNYTPFISAQNEYSLLERRIEAELVPACNQYGVSVLPFFPLASGFLTGKYRQGQDLPAGTRLANAGPMAARVLTDKNYEMLGKLEAFAEARGKTMLDLAIGWLASLSHVGSVIAGATKPEQVAQNVAAGGWRLTAEELAEVDAISKR
ncbi:MAG: aldo/keto reductase [Dehalococcoidia bacterium]|uniref:aldo/keto reductase n=1 Tax=Candidatus Amarobacter glycogenicus TaxID=3140699 RepID=UPI003134B42E|nr:aldo/keto reductase [Dehalococcoidia bacterium]MBK7329763.1 aldo/keto reductase [Dehalococcoidia bacterium]